MYLEQIREFDRLLNLGSDEARHGISRMAEENPFIGSGHTGFRIAGRVLQELGSGLGVVRPRLFYAGEDDNESAYHVTRGFLLRMESDTLDDLPESIVLKSLGCTALLEEVTERLSFTSEETMICHYDVIAPAVRVIPVPAAIPSVRA